MSSTTNAKAMLAAALVFLSACTGTSPSRPAAGVVEKINGVEITRVELDRAVKALLTQTGASSTVPPDAMKQASEAALKQLEAAQLLYQAGQKAGMKDVEKQVAARILQSKYQYPSQAEFDKALSSVGMTQKELEEAARKDIVINNFIAERLAPQATVSESEVRKFYQDNKEKAFTHPERVHVSDIMIAVAGNAAPAAKKQAKEKAETVLKRLRSGENFAEVAKKQSDLHNKDRGGDLGTLEKGQSIAAFEKVAFSLQPGEVSGVVETQSGYHIIKVVEKIKPSTDSYEDVKGKIAGLLRREKIRDLVNKYVAELRSKAKIEKV